MVSEKRPRGRPVGSTKPPEDRRVQIHTTVAPATAQKLEANRQDGEGLGDVIDRWAKRKGGEKTMRKRIIVREFADIRRWVEEKWGSEPEEQRNVSRAAEAIANDNNHPPWGKDWGNYLRELNLFELVDCP